jgi:hypothetical protein
VTKVVKKPYTPHIRHKSRGSGGNSSGLPNKTQQTYGTALMKTPFSTNLAPPKRRDQLDRPAPLTNPTPRPTKPPTAKNGVLFPLFFSFLFLRGAEEWRLDFTQRRVK